MELESKYNPAEVEDKWYQYWLDCKLFASKPDAREPYTIVIPPPNVTGVLHMGHVLNETIQDILVRRARQEGKNACWVPGTDHASIATEAKVVGRLAEKGIRKTDLSREEFLNYAWDWTREHGGIILQQLRKLGCSCDWDRTAFTMDEARSRSVTKVFCNLYRKGLIYRGVRMVNWDPKALTALSDEEVIYKEEHSSLYYLKYMVADANGKPDTGGRYAVVATTRPETIMGDTAMCINPNDPKNAWLKGKHVIVPLVGRCIPVIEDEYVDIEFGTGCLKVTPAHDENDYMLGQKHRLPSINIFNDDGTISPAAGLYVGKDRFDVRQLIASDLQAAGLLEKTEAYDNKVGFSERTNVPIEPKLSTQWFLKMEHLAKIALAPVMNDEIKFYPAKYKNTYRHWLENIKDWCISRQLWWGHRIPAYYLPDGSCFVAETPEEALKEAKQKTGNASLSAADLRQDNDALDTWFSSWLWPLSLFDGINHPNNDEINYYYPTSDLVTGPDIIFFWVARMIMAGYEFQQKPPFRNVYFTGIVRDKIGRKMSKSLGNSPDPLQLIARYGADGVRMGMMLSAPAGNDILFDEALCQQGRNFNNKIWNAFRLVKSWHTTDDNTQQPDCLKVATDWFNATLNAAAQQVADLFKKYRLSDALMTIYKLFWDDFSGWYLEIIKPTYGSPIDNKTYQQTLTFFEKLLKLLHPFMPFITEALWQHITIRKKGDSIMTSLLPPLDAQTNDDTTLLNQMETARNIVAAIRNVRNQKNIPNKQKLTLQVTGKAEDTALNTPLAQIITKMAGLNHIVHTTQPNPDSTTFIAGTTEYAIPLGNLIDTNTETHKLTAELNHLEAFLAGIHKKLANQHFLANAPTQVIERERKKQADATKKIKTIKESLAALNPEKGEETNK